MAKFYREGWPANLKISSVPEVVHFYKLPDEIHEENGLLLGLTKLNDKVKKFVYWPGIMSDVIGLISGCMVCQTFQRSKIIFARFGIPKIVIADNNPFGSAELQNFAKQWCTEFRTVSPRYPQSNGLAEKYVGIVNNMLKKCKADGQDFDLAKIF